MEGFSFEYVVARIGTRSATLRYSPTDHKFEVVLSSSPDFSLVVDRSSAPPVLLPREASRLVFATLYSTATRPPPASKRKLKKRAEALASGAEVGEELSVPQRIERLVETHHLTFDYHESKRAMQAFWMLRPSSSSTKYSKSDVFGIMRVLATLLRGCGPAEFFSAVADSSSHALTPSASLPMLAETFRLTRAKFNSMEHEEQCAIELVLFELHKLRAMLPRISDTPVHLPLAGDDGGAPESSQPGAPDSPPSESSESLPPVPPAHAQLFGGGGMLFPSSFPMMPGFPAAAFPAAAFPFAAPAPLHQMTPGPFAQLGGGAPFMTMMPPPAGISAPPASDPRLFGAAWNGGSAELLPAMMMPAHAAADALRFPAAYAPPDHASGVGYYGAPPQPRGAGPRDYRGPSATGPRDYRGPSAAGPRDYRGPSAAGPRDYRGPSAPGPRDYRGPPVPSDRRDYWGPPQPPAAGAGLRQYRGPPQPAAAGTGLRDFRGPPQPSGAGAGLRDYSHGYASAPGYGRVLPDGRGLLGPPSYPGYAPPRLAEMARVDSALAVPEARSSTAVPLRISYASPFSSLSGPPPGLSLPASAAAPASSQLLPLETGSAAVEAAEADASDAMLATCPLTDPSAAALALQQLYASQGQSVRSDQLQLSTSLPWQHSEK